MMDRKKWIQVHKEQWIDLELSWVAYFIKLPSGSKGSRKDILVKKKTKN